MKRSATLWKSGIAVMLALTTLLVWLVVGEPLPTSLHGNDAQLHGAQAASQIHHVHIACNSQYQSNDARLPADCETLVFGCCMMMLCHPAISVDLQHILFEAAKNIPAATTVARVWGSASEVSDPPPRPSFA